MGLNVKLAELENAPAAEAEIPDPCLTLSESFSSGDTRASLDNMNTCLANRQDIPKALTASNIISLPIKIETQRKSLYFDTFTFLLLQGITQLQV